jgi:hypothetical protein
MADQVLAESGELRAMSRLTDANPGTVAVVVNAADRVALLSQDSPPTIKAPAGRVTALGMLLADGWQPADPELRDVALSLETLHAGWKALRATVAGLHVGSEENIGDAIRQADPIAFVGAVVGVAVGTWITQQAGQPTTELSMRHWALLKRRNELCHQQQGALLASLAGLDSEAAATVRAWLLSMRGLSVPPVPGSWDGILY